MMWLQSSSARRQGGAVAVIVGLSMFVLIGMIGLVLDLGHMYVVKTELQNAADACALAAARELNGDASSLTRAENAGILVGGRNNVGFQSAPVAVTPADITFSPTLSPNSGYLSRLFANPATVKYVMCSLTQANIRMWFMPVLGFGDQTVRAMAVATLAPAQTTCAIPVGVCTKGPAPGFGLVKGEWLDNGIYDPGGGGTGSYNWIDFNPGAPTTGCGSSQGANELKCLLAEKPQCNLPTVGAQVGQQGYDNSLTAAYNTRFGLYKGSYNVTNNPPDYSGFAYLPSNWPNASPENAFLGAPASGSTPNYAGGGGALDQNLPYQFNPGSTTPPEGYVGGGYSTITSAQHKSSGTNRRVAIAPLVDCADLAASNPQSVAVKGFACIFMLKPIDSATAVKLEFLGMANEPGNPCATSGLAGGTVGPLVPVLVQ